MMALPGLVGNLVSRSVVQRQVTRMIALKQINRFQSNDGSSGKNFTLKLPPNANQVSVDHSIEKSPDGNNLRVTFNISALQSDTNQQSEKKGLKHHECKSKDMEKPVPQTSADQQPETKSQNRRKLEIKTCYLDEKEIWIYGLPKEISEDSVQDYFSRFGDIRDICYIPWFPATIEFKSINGVNNVLGCAPHYIVGNIITNQLELDDQDENTEAFLKHTTFLNYEETKDPSHRQLLMEKGFARSSIQIHGLPKKVSEDSVRDYFSQFGDVEFYRYYGPYTGAVVEFKSPNAVDDVLQRRHFYVIGNKISQQFRAAL